MAKAEAGERVLATNRKAHFHYEVLERAEAGLALVGTEVKSIREGGLNFSDSYVDFRGGELFLVGCRIAPYSHGNLLNHAPDRDRKLLLHKREILKLGGKVTERGLTLVPLRAYMKNGRVKMEIGLARGKHAHDKRESIKKKDQEREARQALHAGRSCQATGGARAGGAPPLQPGGARGGGTPSSHRKRVQAKPYPRASPRDVG